MRKIPMVLAGLFLAITLVRVADFSAQAMRAGWLGWLFSAGLGAAVYTSSYFLRVSAVDRDGEETERSRVARRSAMLSFVLFIIVDGFFNLSEVLRTVPELDYRLAAVVYGVFPTAAAGLLGYMQGHVDRLPVPPKKYSIGLSVRVLVARWLDSKTEALPAAKQAQPEIVEAGPAVKQIAAPAENLYHCASCDFVTTDPDPRKAQRSLAAHVRWNHKKENALVEN